MTQITVENTASRGIATAAVFRYEKVDLTPDAAFIDEDKIPDELEKFASYKEQVLKDLEDLAKDNEIFEAHMAIADDFALQEAVEQKIKEEKKNVESAVFETVKEFAGMFELMEDEYMRERSADVIDIGNRFLLKAKGLKKQDLSQLTEPVIVVAGDLLPSDTAGMCTEFVKGIITQEGGATSHVCIMAKNYEIPILTGVAGIVEQTKQAKMICMDAEAGVIVIDPDKAVLEDYINRQSKQEQEQRKLQEYREKEPVTKDGKRLSLCINVGSIKEIELALDKNVDGVGLFRTEFLYMENSHFPTEEEQFEVYKKAAKLCPKEVTIRTLDIGGDKKLPYYEFEKEENPFLGWRAIRISLDMKDMFMTQLRAILRASVYGNVRIMFPMIISMEELKEAKAIVEECKKQLSEEGLSFNENIETGMMMETPASVILAEEFAAEADFFSIGTNDLTQYILAVDRGNKKIASRYNSMHPAVLEAVKMIIAAGHKHGIRVGMCGELAGDAKAAAILLEMGLDEFSVSAGNADYVRRAILEN